VPTPTKGSKWHAQTVIRLIRRIGKEAPHYANQTR
jgi:hypothetical protein